MHFPDVTLGVTLLLGVTFRIMECWSVGVVEWCNGSITPDKRHRHFDEEVLKGRRFGYQARIGENWRDKMGWLSREISVGISRILALHLGNSRWVSRVEWNPEGN